MLNCKDMYSESISYGDLQKTGKPEKVIPRVQF